MATSWSVVKPRLICALVNTVTWLVFNAATSVVVKAAICAVFKPWLTCAVVIAAICAVVNACS